MCYVRGGTNGSRCMCLLCAEICVPRAASGLISWWKIRNLSNEQSMNLGSDLKCNWMKSKTWNKITQILPFLRQYFFSTSFSEGSQIIKISLSNLMKFLQCTNVLLPMFQNVTMKPESPKYVSSTYCRSNPRCQSLSTGLQIPENFPTVSYVSWSCPDFICLKLGR